MKPFTCFSRQELIAKWLNKSGKVLDVGCAYGDYTKLYAEKCESICGVDPNRELIEKARKNHPRVEFLLGKAEELPFDEKEFDVVILGDVIEHVDDENKVVDEVSRVLKSGGVLILTTPNKGVFSFMDVDNYSWYYRKLLGIKTNKPGYQNKHRHYSLEDLRKLLGSGFEILEVYRSSLFLSPFISNILLLLRLGLGKKMELKLRPGIYKMSKWDFSIPYGRYAYNIGICARKV